MRLPWRCDPRIIEPSCIANPRLTELETAKEILAEVFHARPADVNEVIQKRLAEMARKHSSEAFYCLDDPLEAAVFSVLVELMREQPKGENKG